MAIGLSLLPGSSARLGDALRGVRFAIRDRRNELLAEADRLRAIREAKREQKKAEQKARRERNMRLGVGIGAGIAGGAALGALAAAPAAATGSATGAAGTGAIVEGSAVGGGVVGGPTGGVISEAGITAPVAAAGEVGPSAALAGPINVAELGPLGGPSGLAAREAARNSASTLGMSATKGAVLGGTLGGLSALSGTDYVGPALAIQRERRTDARRASERAEDIGLRREGMGAAMERARLAQEGQDRRAAERNTTTLEAARMRSGGGAPRVTIGAGGASVSGVDPAAVSSTYDSLKDNYPGKPAGNRIPIDETTAGRMMSQLDEVAAGKDASKMQSVIDSHWRGILNNADRESRLEYLEMLMRKGYPLPRVYQPVFSADWFSGQK